VQRVLERAAAHRGAAFIEILQNCVIFNDGAFDALDEGAKVFVEHGKPIAWDGKGIALHGVTPAIVDETKAFVHDETSLPMAQLLAGLERPEFPAVLGVLRAVRRPTFDELVSQQIDGARAAGPASLQDVLESGETWAV
jgi:2-oxoglutarate ferredoxin oxidoreductase subunit beta